MGHDVTACEPDISKLTSCETIHLHFNAPPIQFNNTKQKEVKKQKHKIHSSQGPIPCEAFVYEPSVEMKADGTLDSLIQNELKAYINSDPVAKDLPKFEGAQTIKVGVTGDIPPMDLVASNGKAAGFNIALLTEIANRAQVNFELVQIESSARPISLSSGKVDAVFWTKGVTCPVCGATGAEKIEGTLVTESYFSDYAALIKLKDNK